MIALLAAAAVLATGCDGSQATPTTTRGAPADSRYVDPLGWSLTYPRTMHLERSRSASYINLTVAEVTLASFPVSNPIHSGHTASSSWMRVSPPGSPHGGFPATGIAIRVMRQEGGPPPDLELPESRFPIKLATFGPSSEYPHTTPAALQQAVTADGLNYTVQAWIGPKAATAARSELARVVSSLRFPRPRVGQTIGDGFRVFPPAKRYPLGSFTRVRVAGKPFYLVHAPGGFYAIGWNWETLSGGYKSRCDLRFDSAQKQFSCTNMRARWDRVGRVLAKPVGAKRGDPLNIAVAKLAWDGHVLLNPDVASFADERLAHQLWPTASGPMGLTRGARPPGARLVDSIGASDGVVWAIDRHGFVWLTMDSGRTWRVSLRSDHWPKRVKGKPFKVRSPRVIADLNQVQFVDKRHGWISATLDGDPFTPPVDTRPWAIERTVDGGRTWRVSWLPGCGCDGGFLSFYDARHGFVLASNQSERGNLRLFWTEDGGASWQLVAGLPRHLDGPITFLNRRDGLLGTYPGGTITGLGDGPGKQWPGVLYRTTDGGKTWTRDRVPPASLALFLPVSSFGRRLVVLDGTHRANPKVYASVDGGTHWAAASVPPLPAKARAIDFSVGSPKMWVLLTSGRLYVTRDGGQSWERIVPRGLSRPDDIYPIVFSSPSVGWTLMTRFKELYRTTDGGRHWMPAVLRRSTP